MSTTLRGTRQPLQQRFTEKWSPVNGLTREFEWDGFDGDLMQGYANQYAFLGIEYELTSQYGRATLHAIDTTGTVTIDKWEIQVNRLSPSSLQNPLNIANVSSDDLITIGKVQIGNLSYEDGKAAINSGHTAALRLLDRMNLGSDQFYQSGYILRHTTNVGNRYAINISDFNIDHIYTPAQLLTEAQNGALWLLPLPGRLVYKIQQIVAPAVRANYLWGWIKSAASESTAANNRIDIATEYELGQWSTDEYTTV